MASDWQRFWKGASKLLFTEGLETDAVAIQIAREEVHHYCKAIGEENLIFHNSDAARKAGYADVVLPAAYPVLFWRYIHIPWLEGASSIIQSEQHFEYDEPLVANETYICQIMLTRMRQKGKRQFLQHVLSIKRNDRTAATSSSTLVLV